MDVFLNIKNNSLYVDNFTNESFKYVIKSERWLKIMGYLASPNFDIQTMTKTLSGQHYVST